MGLVNAKCTNCGGILQVDDSKEAAICPFCESAYIVEKAINNYNINITNNVNFNNATININGAVVHVNENVDIDGLVQRGKECLKYHQFEECEKCFKKVLEKDSQNECAKKGMMLTVFFSGLIEWETNARVFLDDKFVKAAMALNRWGEMCRDLNDNIVYKALSYYDDPLFVADFLGLRGAYYESAYYENGNYLMDLPIQYYSISSELLKKINLDNSWGEIGVKRAQYIKKHFFGSSFGELFISQMGKKGLFKIEDGLLLRYNETNPEHLREIKEEFGIFAGDKLLDNIKVKDSE